jgi:hypothetical protein
MIWWTRLVCLFRGHHWQSPWGPDRRRCVRCAYVASASPAVGNGRSIDAQGSGWEEADALGEGAGPPLHFGTPRAATSRRRPG